MAKAYRAVTEIRHGQQNAGDGSNELLIFKAGDVVKGLPNDVMKNLWDAGALEQVDVVEVDKASTEEEQQKQEGEVTPSE